MKKYKLKQWYPSLPHWFKEGYTVNWVDALRRYSALHPKTGAREFSLTESEVEQNPEFWEEVEEKDYEILKIKQSNGWMWNKRYSCEDPKPEKNPLFDCGDITHSLEYMLYNDDNYDIYSVKRLSDGEVFTIGDKVEHWISALRGFNKWSISSFRIKSGKMLAYSGTGFHKRLEDISKRKEPLFTTDDGFAIHKKDRYWAVTSGLYLKPSIATDPPQEYKAKFATKERAKEYIEEHRVRYSKADIKEALAKALGSNSGDLTDVTFKPYKFKDLLNL